MLESAALLEVDGSSVFVLLAVEVEGTVPLEPSSAAGDGSLAQPQAPNTINPKNRPTLITQECARLPVRSAIVGCGSVVAGRRGSRHHAPMARFNGQVVVITGAGSGIGKAAAHAFAELGAIVHVVDLHGAKAQETAGELRLSGALAWAHEADVRDQDALQDLATKVYEQHGRCDVLINNAGVGHSGFVQDLSLDEWRWVIDTNLWGVIHGVHAFVPRMIEQGGGGHILNTASMLGLMGLPSMAPYSTSKFAVVGLSESLGIELAPHDIFVSAICPGVIDTNIVNASKLAGSQALRDRVAAFYRTRGIAPQRVAKDMVEAVKRKRPLALTAGSSYPALMLKRLSPRLYRGVAAFAASKIYGSASASK